MAEDPKLKAVVLRRLGLPAVAYAEETFEVVVTLLGPRELDEEPMRESFALSLTQRVRTAIDAAAEGRRTKGVVRSKVDYSDDANCEDLNGQQVNAFEAGERCYRVVLTVATQ